MPYIGNQPGTGVRSRFIYTATASQTTFSGADNNSKTLKYADSDYIDVYLNGVCLVPGTDYTASTKTSVVLVQAASVSDTLEVVAYDIATISDTVSKADGGTFNGDLGITNASPDITLTNNTTEDTDGGRESTVTFKGLQSGGEESTLAEIQGSHDGTADDEKGDLIFKTNDGSDGASPTEAMRLTSDQKLGLGTASPEGNVHVRATIAEAYLQSDDGQLAQIVFGDASDSSRGRIYYDSSDNMVFATNNLVERARIESSGHVLIATNDSTPWTNNANSAADKGIALRAEGFIAAANHSSSPMDLNRTGSDGNLINFYKSGSNIGSISVTSSATAYNTSSDHRLKENVTDVTDGITRVKQLAPKRFNFIVNPDTTVDGFIAHEVQVIVPEAITGTKDQVKIWADGDELPDGVSVGDNKLDDDGKTIPVMQGIDQAKLVPLLTAALQEAIAKIETLETKVTALEAG